MKRGRPGDWHIPGTVLSDGNFYNLSAVLSWLLLFYAYADGVHFTVSSPLLRNVPNTYPVGPFAQFLWEALSVLSPTLLAFFSKHPKTRNDESGNGSRFGRDKIRLQTLKYCWRKLIKNALARMRRRRFLQGHVDPSYLYFAPLLFLRLGSETILSEKAGGGTCHQDDGVERYRCDLSIGSLLGVCTLHLSLLLIDDWPA